MLTDLLMAAGLLVTAALLLAELRAWWRPQPPRGALRRRLESAAPARPRPRLSLRSHQFQALLIGAATIAAIWLLSANLLLAVPAGLIAGFTARAMLPRMQQRRLADQARSELRIALGQLVVSLNAGQSLATALQAWPRGLERALGPGQWVLVPQVQRVCEDLDRGATPEEALAALAERVGLEELRMLAEVVRLCRRRGADLGQAVTRAAQMLGETLEVRSELQSLTAGKRAEGLIITFLPPAMLLLIAVSNPEYASPLIHTHAGRLILALALLMEAASFFVSRWLLQGDP